ncbi:MAG: HAMP domain-containing histidine kinase, partial [Anaerolinea sp.]|nr:HAMP domain-containing histidine kinase [Anaerolinea sp.]
AFRRQISSTALPGQPVEAILKALPLSEDTRARLLAALNGTQAFKLELKLEDKTYNAEGAPVDSPDGTRDWVILINDVSTLADLNQLRTQMIRMTSHDIRNPLNTILGFAELLAGEDGLEYDERAKKEFLGYIISSAYDIKRILEGVLNLERVRTEALTKESISMARVIEEVVDRLRANAKARQQTLTVTLARGDLGVRGDPFQLHQAIFNLVENAIKYTREGGRIAVRAREEAGSIVIEVEDNGYGIPAEAQANIFKEFFRAVRGEAAHIRGTGLGLSLVKTIIDLHDGSVSFTSVEGQGTTFTVKLPAFTPASVYAAEPAHA